jgi:hypothetical protein
MHGFIPYLDLCPLVVLSLCENARNDEALSLRVYRVYLPQASKHDASVAIFVVTR